jgi:flagellar basal body-associated protein FliL
MTILRKSPEVVQLQNFTNSKQSINLDIKNSDKTLKKRKLWIFLGVLLVSILVLAFLIGRVSIASGDKDNKTYFYCEIPELMATVKLKEEGYRTVKLSLSVKVQGSKSLKYINKNLPVLQNAFVLLLSSIRSGDIDSGGFAEKLLNELQKRAENLFPGMIKAVLIREILLQ